MCSGRAGRNRKLKEHQRVIALRESWGRVWYSPAAVRDDYDCFYSWLHATWAPSQSIAVAKRKKNEKKGKEKRQTDRQTGGGGGARAWRTAAGQVHEGGGGMRSHRFQWSAAHVAVDQGATIGSTYRCFGLAARCDPVMRWMDGWTDGRVRVVCGWRFRERR